MYTLSIAYNDDSKEFFQAISELLKNNYPQVTLAGYNENIFKSRNKAFKLKGGWSARMTPFALITDEEDNPLKVFYSEAEECTIDNIKFYLDTIITSLKKMNMKVSIINNSTNQLPQYETPASAGMDIRADFSRVAVDNPIKVWGESEIIFAGEAHSKTLLRLEPGSRALIPTGIFTAIPVGYEVQLRPRSGLAIKHGLNLINCIGTIDADYRAEWGIPVVNQGLEPVWIEDGERICQAVLNKVEQIEWEVVNSLNETDRAGGFGSTGVK